MLSMNNTAPKTLTTEDWAARLRTAIRRTARRAQLTPTFSIVTPVWNTKPSWFAEAALSLFDQTYGAWEWCVVDDASTDTEFHKLFAVLEEAPHIRILKLDKPHGISGATNQGLEMASGEWVGFLDHDDLLTPDALEEVAGYVSRGYDAVYTDSDKIDEAGVRRDPFHKPNWSPEFFRGVMYVGHLLCVRRDLAKQVKGFRKQFDGVQDFEFMLRISERTKRIGHIGKILYHWRAVPGSIALDGNAKPNIQKLQCAAVQEHLDRMDLDAVAEPGPFPHRVLMQPRALSHKPKVSIVIPTKDAPDLIGMCLESLFAKTAYPNLEVICIDNGSTDERALRTIDAYPVKRIVWPGAFNFSAVNNLGVSNSGGEFLVLMNNDIETVAPDWVEQMLYYARQDDVGAVGGMLLYPDRTVQHAGVVLGCRGTADHVLRGANHDCDGYAGSLSCAREVSAVTAACMMVRRSVYDAVGGFNEHFFTAYQDVDLCLKISQLGKRNIYTPRAVFVHHESASRGRYYDFVDRNLLLDMWEPVIQLGDPFFNSNFDVQACDYSVRAGV